MSVGVSARIVRGMRSKAQIEIEDRILATSKDPTARAPCS